MEELTARKEHALRVDRQRVDNCIMSAKVEDEVAFWTLPFLDIVAASRG